MMETISFAKMSGSGNDFIVVDNRDGVIDETDLPDFIRQVCRRKMSVGADGFILIERSDNADFRWRFFNSDGSKAEMCGNGARCVARFARVNGIAGENLTFEAETGIVHGRVDGDRAKVKMPDPSELRLDYSVALKDGPLTLSSVNTGVPHVVVLRPDVDDMEVVPVGREIRYHKVFAPAGTNVNFVSQIKAGKLAIRTYERGVEDETLACGTGCIAAALVTACKLNWNSPVHLRTRSGEILTIYFANDDGVFSDIYLEGDARIIYTGRLQPDAWKR
jgi:diaminopimelate epimerase